MRNFIFIKIKILLLNIFTSIVMVVKILTKSKTKNLLKQIKY